MSQQPEDPPDQSAPPPWEPPTAGSDVEHLLGMLDRLRWTFRWKASGLDDAGLAATVGASSLTLGGLLKHLAAVESIQLTWKAFGRDPGPPWNTADWDSTPDWDLRSAGEQSAAELYALYDDAVAASRERLQAALADGGIDQPTQADDGRGGHASLRRLVCDLVEEYGRHTGHADLLRESVDGLVGEDPPPDWRP
ncbi:DUF664 domain-containing protein [Nocardioides daphniae]|uniref:Mini-circle protein n=1 Tax=Nocardioides daphniae TaxID=402297 RepID=A0ABQ1PYD9_9ACTN|nr:DUF664 domain-containing protein [Nocardioides daphniae]GGD06130.1 mini-circle protein [Nocardioides daphniae]